MAKKKQENEAGDNAAEMTETPADNAAVEAAPAEEAPKRTRKAKADDADRDSTPNVVTGRSR